MPGIALAPMAKPWALYMIIFGVLELMLSQLPSLEEISWLSIVASIMSFAYSSIGLDLSIAKVAGLSCFNICACIFSSNLTAVIGVVFFNSFHFL
jgi:hypothetical protein